MRSAFVVCVSRPTDPTCSLLKHYSTWDPWGTAVCCWFPRSTATVRNFIRPSISALKCAHLQRAVEPIVCTTMNSHSDEDGEQRCQYSSAKTFHYARAGVIEEARHVWPVNWSPRSSYLYARVAGSAAVNANNQVAIVLIFEFNSTASGYMLGWHQRIHGMLLRQTTLAQGATSQAGMAFYGSAPSFSIHRVFFISCLSAGGRSLRLLGAGAVKNVSHSCSLLPVTDEDARSLHELCSTCVAGFVCLLSRACSELGLCSCLSSAACQVRPWQGASGAPLVTSGQSQHVPVSDAAGSCCLLQPVICLLLYLATPQGQGLPLSCQHWAFRCSFAGHQNMPHRAGALPQALPLGAEAASQCS